MTVLPHIEKRFNLSSFDSGMIAAANDVPAIIFGLFVAHWGHFSNKVRWIGVGGIITGTKYLTPKVLRAVIPWFWPQGGLGNRLTKVFYSASPLGNFGRVHFSGVDKLLFSNFSRRLSH